MSNHVSTHSEPSVKSQPGPDKASLSGLDLISGEDIYSASSQSRLAKKLFWLWSCIHLMLWTFGPFLVRRGLPFDTIEGIAWGNQLQWGYNKHPPLAGWLSALFYHLFGVFGPYLVAQLAVITAFYAVFVLARQVLKPLQAFASVLLLEGVIYYTIISPKFNPTTLMTPMWILLTLALYFAVLRQKWWQWIAVGLCAALTVLTKYQSPFIFAGLFMGLMLTSRGRQVFRTPGPYLGLGVMILALIPHAIWQVHQHFIEIRYLLNSKNGEFVRATLVQDHGLLGHIYYPFMILVSELGAIAAMGVILLAFWKAPRESDVNSAQMLSPENADVQHFSIRFLACAAFFPFAFTLLFALISGCYLYAKWFTPYFSLWGVFLMLWIRPVFTPRVLKRFLWTGMTVGCLFWAGRYGFLLFHPMLTGRAHPDAYFPDQAVAAHVEHIWAARALDRPEGREGAFHTPVPIVAGSHYLTAVVNVYAKDHPVPYMDWSSQQSAWMNDATLNREGGVFLWYASPSDPHAAWLPVKIAERFPRAEPLGVVSFSKQWPAPAKDTVSIAFAYLPPASS